jgi:hypothetical protein
MASDSGTARTELIAAIRARQADFTAAGDRAEAERNLPTDTMEILRELGAFWLKTRLSLRHVQKVRTLSYRIIL